VELRYPEAAGRYLKKVNNLFTGTYIMSHRTQITLTDEQYERLRVESQRSGLGLAELVRRAVDRIYGSIRPEETVHALDVSFGSWADRTDDGASYVDGLRRGMARRFAD
jgi:hypothetical protein